MIRKKMKENGRKEGRRGKEGREKKRCSESRKKGE